VPAVELIDAAAALTALRKRHGGTALAGKLGVSDALLRAVAKGERRCAPKLRTKLTSFGIPASAWDQAPVVMPVPISLPVSPVAPTVAAGLGTTLAEIEATVLRLKRQNEAVDADPLSSHRDKATLAAALNQALRARSRALGEEDVTKGKVLASRQWKELRTALAQALAPEEFASARRAVLEALAAYSEGPP
jgi:hypothetical protein